MPRLQVELNFGNCGIQNVTSISLSSWCLLPQWTFLVKAASSPKWSCQRSDWCKHSEWAWSQNLPLPGARRGWTWQVFISSPIGERFCTYYWTLNWKLPQHKSYKMRNWSCLPSWKEPLKGEGTATNTNGFGAQYHTVFTSVRWLLTLDVCLCGAVDVRNIS